MAEHLPDVADVGAAVEHQRHGGAPKQVAAAAFDWRASSDITSDGPGQPVPANGLPVANGPKTAGGPDSGERRGQGQSHNVFMSANPPESEPRRYTLREQFGLYYRRGRDDLRPGDHVVVDSPLMRGQMGTLLRKARLANGKPSWLIKMDDPTGLWRGRTRVAERSIVKPSQAPQ